MPSPDDDPAPPTSSPADTTHHAHDDTCFHLRRCHSCGRILLAETTEPPAENTDPADLPFYLVGIGYSCPDCGGTEFEYVDTDGP